MPARSSLPTGGISRRRLYGETPEMQAAYLAGRGLSTDEIAAEVGLPATRLRSMLRKAGISTARRVGEEVDLVIRWTRPDRIAFEKVADDLNLIGESLAVAMLRAVMAETKLMANLIDREA